MCADVIRVALRTIGPRGADRASETCLGRFGLMALATLLDRRQQHVGRGCAARRVGVTRHAGELAMRIVAEAAVRKPPVRNGWRHDADVVGGPFDLMTIGAAGAPK